MALSTVKVQADPYAQQIAVLAATTITTAVTKGTSTPITDLEGVKYIAAQAIFTYGSSGTTAKFYLQTSIDGGTTWTDIMCWSFTTSSSTKYHVVKKEIAVAADQAIKDNELTNNTILDGVIGDRIRISYTTTGTYAGSTTIKVDAILKG